MPETGKGKSGTRAYGRNADKCKRYKLENRREKNKRRREEKRKKRFAKRAEKRAAEKKKLGFG